jgi:hypothetical protein
MSSHMLVRTAVPMLLTILAITVAVSSCQTKPDPAALNAAAQSSTQRLLELTPNAQPRTDAGLTLAQANTLIRALHQAGGDPGFLLQLTQAQLQCGVNAGMWEVNRRAFYDHEMTVRPGYTKYFSNIAERHMSIHPEYAQILSVNSIVDYSAPYVKGVNFTWAPDFARLPAQAAQCFSSTYPSQASLQFNNNHSNRWVVVNQP